MFISYSYKYKESFILQSINKCDLQFEIHPHVYAYVWYNVLRIDVILSSSLPQVSLTGA